MKENGIEFRSGDEKKITRENAAAGKKQDGKNPDRKNRILLGIMAAVVLVVGVVVCLFARWYTHAVYAYERIGAEEAREEMDMNQCMCMVTVDLRGEIDGSDYYCGKYFCVFETGDVYCFEISNPDYDVFLDIEERMGNVVYLGRFSGSERRELERYIDEYDPKAEIYIAETTVGNGGGSSENLWESGLEPDASVVELIRDRYEESWEDPAHDGRIYWFCSRVWLYKKYNPQHAKRLHDLVESDGSFNWIDYQLLDENAIAAVKLVRLSDFFDRFATIYLREQ